MRVIPVCAARSYSPARWRLDPAALNLQGVHFIDRRVPTHKALFGVFLSAVLGLSVGACGAGDDARPTAPVDGTAAGADAQETAPAPPGSASSHAADADAEADAEASAAPPVELSPEVDAFLAQLQRIADTPVADVGPSAVYAGQPERLSTLFYDIDQSTLVHTGHELCVRARAGEDALDVAMDQLLTLLGPAFLERESAFGDALVLAQSSVDHVCPDVSFDAVASIFGS